MICSVFGIFFIIPFLSGSTMASSQVEIASSSPFGCVLKDHNRRDGCRETNARAAAFQKNLKDLVRDHLHNRITVSADEHHENENANSHSHKQVDAWFAKQQGSNGNGNGNVHSRNLRFLSNNNNKNNGKNNRTDEVLEGDYGSSIMTTRQSRILDRWAAKQAREMVSTIEEQTQEAELLASSSSSSSTSSSSNCKKENLQNSPSKSEAAIEVCNLGASSLVQMWEKRLNLSNSLKNFINPVSISSRTSSGVNNIDCEVSRGSEMGDSVEERYITRANNEDSLAVWRSQSDKRAQSEPPTRRHSDAAESEKVKIADIIKRLKGASDDTNVLETGTSLCLSPSRERRHSPVTDQAEQREQQRENTIFPRLICLPRIRGRQAFADLLIKLERDRHRELDLLGERQAVSKFPHRGRLQAMLRLRFLHRGMAIQDQQPPQLAGSRSFNWLSHRAAIKHLRKKFSVGTENEITAQNDATTSRNPQAGIENDGGHSEDSSTASRLREDCHLQEATTAGRKSTDSKEISVLQISKDHQKESSSNIDVKQKRMDMGPTSDHQKEASPKTDVKQKRIDLGTTSDYQKEVSPKADITRKGINEEMTFHDLQGTAETTSSLNCGSKRSEIPEEHEVNQALHINSKCQENFPSTASLDAQNTKEMADEQEVREQQQLCLDSQENAETTASLNDWDENELAEEEEAYFQDQFLETNYDWISEISRPRSYWEDRRRTWYQEMLNSSSAKEEIRQLLEKGRVSTVLSSDFRGTMDQLMSSRVERQTELEAYHEEVEEMSREAIGQLLLAHLQRHIHSESSQEREQAEERDHVQQVDEPTVVEEEQEEEEDEEPEEEEDEDEEEEHNPMSPMFHEATNDFDQSWSYQAHEVEDESDPVASISSPQLLPSQTSYQDGRQSPSSSNHLSIETEIIYDLRDQIKQLHREMSELRKTVQTCMNMQVKEHQSNQQEVHPVKGLVGNNSLDGPLKKRSCCICYEMQVDSLLYRCGHMCTCLKCAHELQWSSGKCPICRAPIDDVVRAFMDS